MKTKLFILMTIFIFMVGCISTGTNGYIKTKNNKVTKFEDAYVITFSKEVWVIEKEQETGFSKKHIKEIHLETDTYR